jgi:hypothetical protein
VKLSIGPIPIKPTIEGFTKQKDPLQHLYLMMPSEYEYHGKWNKKNWKGAEVG